MSESGESDESGDQEGPPIEVNNGYESDLEDEEAYEYRDEDEDDGEFDPIDEDVVLKRAVELKPSSSLPPKMIKDAGGSFPSHGCERRVSQNLVHRKKYKLPLPFYEEREQAEELDASLLPMLGDFAQLQIGLTSRIFSVDTKILSIYFDAKHRRSRRKTSIAFNIGGRIFLNAAYYIDFQLKTKMPLSQICHFWFITLCHELAHNLEGAHNQRHGHITQALENKYFLGMCAFLGLKVDELALTAHVNSANKSPAK